MVVAVVLTDGVNDAQIVGSSTFSSCSFSEL